MAIIFGIDSFSNFCFFEAIHDLSVNQIASSIKRISRRFKRPKMIIGDCHPSFVALTASGSSGHLMKDENIIFITRQGGHQFSNKAERVIKSFKYILKDFLGNKTMTKSGLTAIDYLNLMNHATSLVNAIPMRMDSTGGLGFTPAQIIQPNLNVHSVIQKLVHFLAFEELELQELSLGPLVLSAYNNQIRNHLIKKCFEYTEDMGKTNQVMTPKVKAVIFFERNQVWKIGIIEEILSNNMCKVRWFNTNSKKIEYLSIHIRKLKHFFYDGESYL